MARKRYLDSFWRPLGKAIAEYGLIQDGDKIAAGISGGKDSLTLLYALNDLKRISPVKFELYAVTVDMGLGMNFASIRDFCRAHQIRWSCVHTMIGPIVFDYRHEPNPCSLCSKLRSGALHSTAIQLGCNKVSLAHHLDDAIETFFLCLFYERRIKTFQPSTYLSKRKITLIRPLIFVREKTIAHLAAEFQLPVIANPCPANHHTKREEMKQLVASLEDQFPGVRDRMLTAFRTAKPECLWLK